MENLLFENIFHLRSFADHYALPVGLRRGAVEHALRTRSPAQVFH